MRLKVQGIPRFVLFLVGLIPGAMWFAFHYETFFFRWGDAVTIGIATLLLAIGFTYAYRRGIFRSRYLIFALVYLQVLRELWSGVMDREFSHIFIVLIMGGVVSFLAVWIEKKTQSAGMNPLLSWFQGEPECLPRVMAQVWTGDGSSRQARVRRMDERGMFMLFQDEAELPSDTELSFEIEYRDLKIEGEGKVISSLFAKKSGIGLQFLPKDLYHFTQYTKLVQRLRGEGLLT